MRTSEKVTIKQIAENAGFSIGTVDRALSNRPGISPVTKARVLRVAEELGYTPNKIASALSRKKTLRIAVIYAQKPSDFYSYVDQGVERAAKELADYGVEVERLLSPILGPLEQAKMLESVDFSRYDGVAFNAGGEPSVSIINKVIASGIPVITFNSDAPESDRLFFIGNNSRQSGRLGGEIMAKILGGRGKVAIIGNFINTSTFIDRYGGFCEVIQAQYPGIELYPCAECHSDPDKAYEILTDLLKKTLDINGFFSVGYSSTLGSARAVKDANRPDVRIIGYDLSTYTIQALEEGWCSVLLYQDPYQQGYQAVRLMARHIMEGWLPAQQRLFVETRAVFRYNVENFTKARLQHDPFL